MNPRIYSVMFLSASIWIVAPAAAEHKSVVNETHPTGGPGALGKTLEFNTGDPAFRIVPPGKGGCNGPSLHGFAFGHPDPQKKDPAAVCGHGLVFIITEPKGSSAPLSILPIEAPMPVASSRGLTALESARLIRDMLPKLDKSEGDHAPVVMDIRRSITAMDAAKARKNMPKPTPNP